MFVFTSDRSFYRTAPTHRLGYSALSGRFLSPGHPQVASSGLSTPRPPITRPRGHGWRASASSGCARSPRRSRFGVVGEVAAREHNRWDRVFAQVLLEWCAIQGSPTWLVDRDLSLLAAPWVMSYGSSPAAMGANPTTRRAVPHIRARHEELSSTLDAVEWRQPR